jgi:sec-independent protein translocase protein TatA
MLSGIGMPELVVIFLIILLLFGANKIPTLAKDLGKGINEFKKAMNGEINKENESKKS